MGKDSASCSLYKVFPALFSRSQENGFNALSDGRYRNLAFQILGF